MSPGASISKFSELTFLSQSFITSHTSSRPYSASRAWTPFSPVILTWTWITSRACRSSEWQISSRSLASLTWYGTLSITTSFGTLRIRHKCDGAPSYSRYNTTSLGRTGANLNFSGFGTCKTTRLSTSRYGHDSCNIQPGATPTISRYVKHYLYHPPHPTPTPPRNSEGSIPNSRLSRP